MPPLTYNAVSDRDPRPLPALPTIGNAGSTFIDPTFGTRLMRVTDAYTNPGASHVICNTASGGEQNSFNVDSTLFYAQCGANLLFRFDPATFATTLVKDPARPSEPLRLPSGEPEFSFTDPDLLYFNHDSKLKQYKVSTNTMTTLLD